jgi:hypothetical protein
MEYKHYWRNVVMRYHVVLEGWPDDIPFRNLSETSSPLDSLEKLLQRLQHKKTYWKKLTDNEFKKLDREHSAQMENGEVDTPAPHRRRSDYGKKRSRTQEGSDSRKKRNKSKRAIDDEDDNDRDDEATSAPTPSTTNISTTNMTVPAMPTSEPPAGVPKPIVAAACIQTPAVPAPLSTVLCTGMPVTIGGIAATVDNNRDDEATSAPTPSTTNIPTTNATAPAMPTSEPPAGVLNPVVATTSTQTPAVPALLCTVPCTGALVTIGGLASTVDVPSVAHVQASEGTESV